MGKKKQQINGFSLYMDSIMSDLRREGRVFPNGKADVVPIAHPRWKALSEEERERFEKMAKEYKKKLKGPEGDKYRLDNVGNNLAYRKDPEEELKKRKEKEKKQVVGRWPVGKGLVHEKFYFISFETLCETEEGDFLPCEMGLVEFCLHSGITKTLHKFIDPGSIPLGYRFLCQSNSDDTHKIPIQGFKLASDNYLGMWIEMENFVNPSGEKDYYPPIFCLESQARTVEYCMEWLHVRSCVGYANRLKKIFIFDNILPEFYAHVGSPRLSIGHCKDALGTTMFDYETNTRCPWHEDAECKHCALATSKKICFVLSDLFSKLYNFDLTASHLPSQSEPVACTILSPNAIPAEPRMPRERSQQNGSWQEVSTKRDTGPFAARDYRILEKEKDEEEEVVTEYPQTLRRPNLPDGNIRVGYEAPRAPWASACSVPAPTYEQSEWPSLGGGETSQPAVPTESQLNAAPEKTVGLEQLPPRRVTLSDAVKSDSQNCKTAVKQPHNPEPAAQQIKNASETFKFAGRQMAPPAQMAPPPPAQWHNQVPPETLGPAARQALAVQQMQQRHMQLQSVGSNKPAAQKQDLKEKDRPEPTAQIITPPVNQIQQNGMRQRVPRAWAGLGQAKTAAPPAPVSNAWNRPPSKPIRPNAWNQPPAASQQSAPAASAWNQPPPVKPAASSASAWNNPRLMQPVAQLHQPGPAPGGPQMSQPVTGFGRGRGRGLYNPNSSAPVRPPPGLLPHTPTDTTDLADRMAGVRIRGSMND